MRVAIYARVSTDQQAEKGYSIETQLEACRRCAHELGAIAIVEFVDDGYSAEFIERPNLTLMRNAIKAKRFDAVIIYDPDRLARNLLHQLIVAEEIDKSGADLKFVVVNYEQSADGRFMFGVRGLLAELEKEKIKERTMRGKIGKASRGLVLSDTKPFGYTYVPDKSTYKINETEAEIVRLIFDLMVNDKLGTTRICKELTSRGIPSPRAKKAWLASTIHRILTNAMYKGTIYSMKYRYEKISLNKRKRTLRPETEWIPIQVPAIVDENVWQAAQRQLQENKDFAKRNLKKEYLLSGLVTCAHCGRAMVISHSGCRKSISYYSCISRRSTSYNCLGLKPCSARQVPTKLLDEYVFKYLLNLYLNRDLISSIIRDVPHCKETQKYRAALDQMNDTENELVKQKDTVLRWFRQKMLSENDVDYQLQDISHQLADIELMKNLYSEKLKTATSFCVAEQISDVGILNLNIENFTLAEKRAALRAIIERVVVKRVDTTRGRGSRPEINVTIKLK